MNLICCFYKANSFTSKSVNHILCKIFLLTLHNCFVLCSWNYLKSCLESKSLLITKLSVSLCTLNSGSVSNNVFQWTIDVISSDPALKKVARPSLKLPLKSLSEKLWVRYRQFSLLYCMNHGYFGGMYWQSWTGIFTYNWTIYGYQIPYYNFCLFLTIIIYPYLNKQVP